MQSSEVNLTVQMISVMLLNISLSVQRRNLGEVKEMMKTMDKRDSSVLKVINS